jgi:hypothetical protein
MRKQQHSERASRVFAGKFFAFAIFLFACFTSVSATGSKPLVFKNGQVSITLEDLISHPLYYWPETLLGYTIVLPENINPENLVLSDEATGEQLPFQIADIPSPSGKQMIKQLYLISNLPSGGKRSLILREGSPQTFESVQVEKTASGYLVRTDKLSLIVPGSKNSGRIPGLFSQLAHTGDASFGESWFIAAAGGSEPHTLVTEIVEQGALFVRFKLTYHFPGGATYTVGLRCIKGYDFIEMTEMMEGFPQNQSLSLEIAWPGFEATHRQAPNHPYGPPNNDAKGIGRFNWETIGQQAMYSQHGITFAGSDGKIPYEVGTYGNWGAELSVTSSAFWDENNNRTIGVFTRGVGHWNSHKYPIWLDTRDLSVKFYYKDTLLRWRYPIMNGTRTTGISSYDHRKDIALMDELEKIASPVKASEKGMTYQVKISQLSYNHFLQNRYSTLCLDDVKDWVLFYPDSLRRPEAIFDNPEGITPDKFEQDFFYGWFSNELPVSGTCQNSGYGPTSSRLFYEKWVPMMNLLYDQMPEEQRKRMTAMYLMHTYIAAGEEYMPMKHMLGGHPNFLADVKSVPAYAAFLFPGHPMANYWADLFGKYIDLNYRYHVRPDVPEWDATGGRWTENSGTYMWGALRPTSRAAYLLEHYFDGKNRMADKHIAQMAGFILNSLSAPFDGEAPDMYYNQQTGRKDMHSWNIVTREDAPARIIPPQGAHSIRRRPPNNYWWLGKELENYDPLLSENIRYVARPEFDDLETESLEKNSFKFMYPQQSKDTGTPPSPESVKMTGYGIVLRADVDTEKEISVHLGQIDNGPNYRWGIAGAGGGGSIYFYAGGKSYSNNGKEDIGDRKLGDTDLTTGFAAFRPGPADPYIGGSFKSIGKNELVCPMYDLGVAQFAGLTSSKTNGYIWPYYQSRSLLLAGSDYFIVYDDVHNPSIGGRFSWFTHIHDSLPEIQVVKPARYEFSRHESGESKGVWFDGSGDFLTFVSHRKGYQVTGTAYGCRISSPEGPEDYVFRNDVPVDVKEENLVFTGTAGIIRRIDPGMEQWALFHGTKIGNGMFEITHENNQAGISANYRSEEDINGECYLPEEARITFGWKSMPAGMKLYLDGQAYQTSTGDNTLSATIPAGKHIWSLTTGNDPTLLRPEIQYTCNRKGKVEVVVHPVAGARSYQYEYSTDQGKSWKIYKESRHAQLTVSPSGKESKGYLRVIAQNARHTSKPSVIYPLYFVTEEPHYPEGMKAELSGDTAKLSWGKVLGCNEYRLYRKTLGGKFALVCKGNQNTFTDRIPATEVYEYAVSAINGNGQSRLSHAVTTDPENIINFDPKPGEPFRRSVTIDYGRDNDGITVSPYYP